MWPARFEGSGTVYVAASFAEAGEFEPAQQIAHKTLSAADVPAQA